MEPSKRVKKMPPSGTVKLFDQIADLLKAEKENGLLPGELRTISLVAGQPDFSTPSSVKKAAHEAIKNDHTKYTKVKGVPELIEAIVAEFNDRTKLKYTSAQAACFNGVKEGLFIGFGALINSGDCVLVFRPCWTSYPAMIELWGGSVCYYDVEPDSDFSNLEKIIEENKVKGVIINSPNNPAGYVLTREQLQCLAEKLRHTVEWIFSDEVYKEILFDNNQHHSIVEFPGMAEKTVVFDGLSKSHAMTGWRIGYALGPEETISAMIKLKGQASSCCCSISQQASVAALTLDLAKKSVREMSHVYGERYKNIIKPFVKKMTHELSVKSYPVQGAFYLFIQIPQKWGVNCKEFCQRLLKEKKVGVVPGEEFAKPGWIRISFAVNAEDLAEGLERIYQFCQS